MMRGKLGKEEEDLDEKKVEKKLIMMDRGVVSEGMKE